MIYWRHLQYNTCTLKLRHPLRSAFCWNSNLPKSVSENNWKSGCCWAIEDMRLMMIIIWLCSLKIKDASVGLAWLLKDTPYHGRVNEWATTVIVHHRCNHYLMLCLPYVTPIRHKSTFASLEGNWSILLRFEVNRVCVWSMNHMPRLFWFAHGLWLALSRRRFVVLCLSIACFALHVNKLGDWL